MKSGTYWLPTLQTFMVLDLERALQKREPTKAEVLLVFPAAVWALEKRAVVDRVTVTASNRLFDVKATMWAYGFFYWNSFVAVGACAHFFHLLLRPHLLS